MPVEKRFRTGVRILSAPSIRGHLCQSVVADSAPWTDVPVPTAMQLDLKYF